MLPPATEPFRLSPCEFENPLIGPYAMFEKMGLTEKLHLTPLLRKNSQKRLAPGRADLGRSIENDTIRKRGPVRLGDQEQRKQAKISRKKGPPQEAVKLTWELLLEGNRLSFGVSYYRCRKYQ